MYTKLTLQKLSDAPVAGDTKPSHAVIASTSDYKNKVRVGAMWLKKGDYGNYLSGQLNEEPRTYKDKEGNEKTDEAYVIITKKEYLDLIALMRPTTKEPELSEKEKQQLAVEIDF